MAPVNAVTYYMAARIIDNNSGISLDSAAWVPTAKIISVIIPAPKTTPPGCLAPVDLQDLVYRTGGVDEMNNNGLSPAGVNPWRLEWLVRGGSSAVSCSLSPIDDKQVTRTDFQYLTWGDLLWQNLGRRVDNPAYAPNNFI